MTMSGNDFRMYQGMDSSEFLAHYGVGHLDGGNSGRFKWGSGERPYQREGSGKRVFVSGSSKTQDKESGYYRRKLPKAVRAELDAKMKNGDAILVGDAPGIDRQVQDYLKKKRYKNVEVYGPGSEDVRYQADKGWKKNLVDDPDHEKGSSEWLAAKDKAMSDAADEGIAVIIGGTLKSKATKRNIARLLDEGKNVSVLELNRASKVFDKWLDDNGKKSIHYWIKRNDAYNRIYKDINTGLGKYLDEICKNTSNKQVIAEIKDSIDFRDESMALQTLDEMLYKGQIKKDSDYIRSVVEKAKAFERSEYDILREEEKKLEKQTGYR